MNSKLWKIFVFAGTMLILSALFLCLYNYNENMKAFNQSQTVLSELKDIIPEPPPQDKTFIEYSIPEVTENLFAEYEEAEKAEKEQKNQTVQEFQTSRTDNADIPRAELDGRWYCGYLTLPSLGIELPVLNEWSYPNLQIAPCRYSGTPETKDFIIAAHNYNSHFGLIKNLSEGDIIYFTECSGMIWCYRVEYIEFINGYDVEQMFRDDDNDWELTLFTCTLGGQSRVTVRAEKLG